MLTYTAYAGWRRAGAWLLPTLALLCAAPALRAADAPAPTPAPAPIPAPRPWTLPELFANIPPLTHDAAGRLPLICVTVFRQSADDRSFEEAKPLPADTIKELAKRGLTQWIPPNPKYIPYALALQQNGAAVVIFEGNAFNGPADEEVPGGGGLHLLPAAFKPEEDRVTQQKRYPCPLLYEGWQRRADKLRSTYRAFKEAGVKLTAAWYDWEVEPIPGASQWREARACSRCQALFPPGVLDDQARYNAFITRLRTQLFSTYLAAPILEIYPGLSICNWEEVCSSAAHPTPSWSGSHAVPPTSLGLFTAANPVAYGNTIWYRYNWKEEWHWPLDVPHMDRVYTQVMLGEISGHAENARAMADGLQSIPWVDRFCWDDPDPKIPILSRPRYREILRHVWLRGADSMQVFNNNWDPKDAAKVAIVNEEIADAVQVYDELLAYRPLLDRGEVMNTLAPTAPDDGPIWSGRRIGNDAVVRAFTQGEKEVPVTLTPFAAGPAVTLAAPPAGATYVLKLVDGKVTVTKVGKK